jgi:sensor c-di-GMP phosphodiesterase-like protein
MAPKTSGVRPTLVTVLLAIAAVAAPVWVALLVAAHHARTSEDELALGYARDVLRRSEVTVDQAYAAINALAATRSADPCSPQNVEIMRKYDFGSKYLQAIGYIRNDRLVCSSVGAGESGGYDVGPVPTEWISPVGARVRAQVRFPFDPDMPYLVIEINGFCVLVDRALALDVTIDRPDVSLGNFARFNGQYVESRGYLNPEWARRAAGLPADTLEDVFVDEGYIVAVSLSRERFFGAIAAVPLHYMHAQTRSMAIMLVPPGVGMGVLFVLVLLYLRRLQTGMPSMLRAALRRDEFFLVYQPIVDLQSLRWVGAEALIRWRRSGGEMVRPDVFIPAAEDAGLINRITERVCEIVARDLDDVFIRHPDLHIAINLSTSDLSTRATIATLERLVSDTGAAPGNLIVEVTERGLLRPDPAREILGHLRAANIRVAVDDFGTGYSSLAQLETFALDYLKIDKLFVDTMRSDAPTSQVVLHIIQMAKSLDLELIAEGVEDSSQAQFLREQGVQYAQGWFFGKPMSIDELVAGYVRSRRDGLLGVLQQVDAVR